MLTPLGLDTESSWQAIRRGEIGIAELTRVQREELDIALAAELKNFKVTEYIEGRSARRMDEVTQYGLIAAREAFLQSGLQAGEFDSNRAGVIFSTGIGGINTFEREKQAGIEKGYNRVSPFFIPLTIANMTAGTVAQNLGLHGLSTAVITACAASTNGLGEALHKIRDGYLDIIVAGGAEAAITPMGVGGFSLCGRSLNRPTPSGPQFLSTLNVMALSLAKEQGHLFSKTMNMQKNEVQRSWVKSSAMARHQMPTI